MSERVWHGRRGWRFTTWWLTQHAAQKHQTRRSAALPTAGQFTNMK